MSCAADGASFRRWLDDVLNHPQRHDRCRAERAKVEMDITAAGIGDTQLVHKRSIGQANIGPESRAQGPKRFRMPPLVAVQAPGFGCPVHDGSLPPHMLTQTDQLRRLPRNSFSASSTSSAGTGMLFGSDRDRHRKFKLELLLGGGEPNPMVQPMRGMRSVTTAGSNGPPAPANVGARQRKLWTARRHHGGFARCCWMPLPTGVLHNRLNIVHPDENTASSSSHEKTQPWTNASANS